MDRGWVKSYRKIEDWEWYKKPLTAHLFQHLIRRANRTAKKWQGYLIPAGCLVTSIPHLAEQTGLSQMQVKTALGHLYSSQDVEKVTDSITDGKKANFTVLKVKNYALYQDDNRPFNRPVTDEHPTDNRPITTNKKVRSKEVKNTTTSYGDTGSDSWESDEMHDRQGMHEEPKGSVIDRVFPEYPYGIRGKLNELYIRLRHKPTAAEVEEWRKALAACHSDEERIRMIRYSLGDNQKGRTYKNLYPERGKKTKPDALPIWYDELPDQQPSRKEDVAEARRLREEILGGK